MVARSPWLLYAKVVCHLNGSVVLTGWAKELKAIRVLRGPGSIFSFCSGSVMAVRSAWASCPAAVQPPADRAAGEACPGGVSDPSGAAVRRGRK